MHLIILLYLFYLSIHFISLFHILFHFTSLILFFYFFIFSHITFSNHTGSRRNRFRRYLAQTETETERERERGREGEGEREEATNYRLDRGSGSGTKLARYELRPSFVTGIETAVGIACGEVVF